MAEIRRCISCNYERGFHISFMATEKGNKVGLICPRCGQSFDIGWVLQETFEKPLPGRKYV